MAMGAGIESLYGLLVDPEFSQLPPEEQYKGRQYIFRELSGKDPEFRKLPVEERRKVLFPIEEPEPSIMEPIKGTAKAIPEAIAGLGKAAYETGKTIVSPPPMVVRPTETIEEAKARRLGIVGRAALRGLTLGLAGEEKEPLLPEEERLAQAAEFITAAAPFGAAIKTGERVAQIARLPKILGAAAGGGAAASVAASPGQGVEQFGTGAGVVGALSGAFGLAGRLFQRLKGREPTSRAEVIEAIREEPAFVEELAKDPEFIQVTEAAKVSPKDLVEFIRQPQDMPLPGKAGVMGGERRGLPAPGETYKPPPETIPEGEQGKLSLSGKVPETTIPLERAVGGIQAPETLPEGGKPKIEKIPTREEFVQKGSDELQQYSSRQGEMTKEQLRNLKFAVPEGGSSITPKRAFDFREAKIKDPSGEWESLSDIAGYKDQFRINEALGKGWEKSFGSANLHLKDKIKRGEKITVYRASNLGEEILPGAYVSESQQYVRQHGETNIPGGKFKIANLEVYPDELLVGAPHEFLYIPRDLDTAFSRLKQRPSPSTPPSGGGEVPLPEPSAKPVPSKAPLTPEEQAAPDISLTKEAAPPEPPPKGGGKPTPTVTALNKATGEQQTFVGEPGETHAQTILHHNLDTGAWDIISSDWQKPMPLTPEEASGLVAKGRKPLETRYQEVAPSTFIRRNYVDNDGPGIKIPNDLKEEFGAWNRWNKKNGVSIDEVATDMYEAGLLPEPTINALLELKGSGRKSALTGTASFEKQMIEAEAAKKINELTETPAKLEYKGKTYEKAIKEGNNVRLVDDKDVVLKKATDILSVEDKVPFEVPEPEPLPRELAGAKPRYNKAERGSVELPSTAELKERFDNALSPLLKFQRAFKHLAQSYDIRNAMSYTKGAGENAAALFGRQMSNDIRGPLRRTYGEQASLAEQALSFVIESKGDPSQLDAFKQKILDSDKSAPYWKRVASQAVDFAKANWKDLDGIANRYGEITNLQISAENANGIPTSYRSGYVMHVHDLGETVGYLAEGRGEPTGFRHIRRHETLADAIAAGLDPKTLNSVDLLQTRLNRGQRMINNRVWIDSLRDMSDPATGKPIVDQPMIEKRADGSVDVRPPDSYSLEQIGFQPVAVQNGYEGIFSALTDPSAFNKTMAGRGFMQAVATGKSMTLLFDTFHLGRVAFWNSLIKSLGIKTFNLPFPSYRKGLTLMDYTPAEIERMARAGEIPQKWLSGLQAELRKTDLAVKSGYNVGRISDALYQDAIHHIKGIGTYNKWLFDQFQRGAMREIWSLEFDRLSQARPELSEMDVARKVSHDLNIRFGNLGREGIFKSRTAQDIARGFFLAPQWNEGLIRSELGAVKQLGELGIDLAKGKGIYSGVLLRSVGGMSLLQFAANQLINNYTRGHPTWENPEEGLGAKVSAWVPDLIGDGPGFFLHPLGLAVETTHLLMQSYEKTDDFYKSLKSYIRSRASVAMRPALTFITNQDFLGRTLKPGTVWAEVVKSAMPAPIGASAAYSAAKEIATGEASETFPGQYQKQLMASAGVKTEQAPSPSQRISHLAREFNTAKGVTPSAEFFAGDYQPLTQAIQLNNRTDAKAALDELLKTKTMKQIIKHYKEWPNHPFTGQNLRERTFFKNLSSEQRTQYKQAKMDRFAVARKAFGLLAEPQRRSKFYAASGERTMEVNP